MALRDLFFKITARDRSGPAFDSVKRNLRETEGAVRSTRERVRDAGRSMQRLGAQASIASAGIVALFRDSISLYDQQARAEARVAQAIRATGGAAKLSADQLFREASALQQVSRFGDEDILGNVTARLLSFGNISGDVFLRAQRLTLDLAAATGKGLAPAVQKLGGALADPVAGLTTLRREGVVFSESQKEVIKNLVATGRAAEAQGLILDQVARSVGGQSAADVQAGAGALAQLSNAWGDLKEVVGGVVGELLPPITGFLRAMIDGFTALPPGVQRFTVIAGGLVVVLGPLVGILGLIVSGMAALSAPVLAAVAAVAGLASAIAALWPHFDTLGQRLSEARGWLVSTGQAAWDGLAEGFRKAWEAVDRYTGGTLERMATLTRNVFSSVFDWIAGALDKLVDRLTKVQAKVTETAASGAQIGAALAGALVPPPERTGPTRRRAGTSGGPAALGAPTPPRRPASAALPKFRLPDFPSIATGASKAAEATERATEKMSRSWRQVGNQVKSTGLSIRNALGIASDGLKDFILRGEFSFRSFADAALNTMMRLADRLLSDVFSQIASGLAAAMAAPGAINHPLGQPAVGATASGGIVGALAGVFTSLFGGLAGYANGGSFEVGGLGGRDRNIAAFKVSRGERVTVTPEGGGAPGQVVNVMIQTPDPRTFHASRAQISAEIARAAARGQRAL